MDKEYIDVLDRNGQLVGRRSTIAEAHQQGLWHQTVHIWIYNQQGEILFQKRAATKKEFPLQWDISASGHINTGESPLAGALRELREELGIIINPLLLKKVKTYKIESKNQQYQFNNKEFAHVYILLYNARINKSQLHPDEIADLQYLSIPALRRNLNHKKTSTLYVPHGHYYRDIISAIEQRRQRQLRLMTLNIGNYHHFNTRKNKIIKFIKKQEPDIVAFQEIRDDYGRNKPGYHQLRQLNKGLNYPFQYFLPTMDINRIKRKDDYHPCLEGIGILSRKQLRRVVEKKLQQHPDDKHSRSILWVKMQVKKNLDFFIVHFSPHDLFSALHLKETLRYAKSQRIKPIIIGDFNIKYPRQLLRRLRRGYQVSTQIVPYLSFPSENMTLDYIAIPSNISFDEVLCSGDNLSDHRALLATITY